MTLTYGQIRDAIRLAVGGDPSTVGGGTATVNDRIAQIANHAGEHLFNRAWRFRERTASGLTIESAENTGAYIDLPTDCGEIISFEPANSWSTSLSFVDPATFQRLSSTGIEPEMSYIVTLVFSGSTPRLDVYPSPPINTSNSFYVRYRSDWTELTAENMDGSTTPNTTLSIAAYVEPLYMEYLRAFAEGGEDGTTQQRIAVIDTGVILDRALRKDGTMVPDYGPLPAAGVRSTGQTYAAGTVDAPATSNILWKGTWSASTTYAKDDLVHYTETGNSYICVSVNGASGNEQNPTYDSYWEVFTSS